MPEFLLVLRDHEQRWDEFTPEEFQAIIGRFMAWNDALKEREQLVGNGKLTADLGRTVRSRGERVVVDGPFAEAKEAIGGYYRVQCGDLDAAVAIASECPILTYGGSVEVREISSLDAPRDCHADAT